MSTNHIFSNPADSAEIELGEDILAIRGPVDIPSGWEWLWWTLGILFAALLAYWLVRKFIKRIKTILPPRIPYVAPYTLARRRLSDAMKLIDDPYRFCTAVSDILRQYIEGQFSLHAPERTTDEFLEELRSDAALTPEQQDLVEEFLNQCDRVKFAKETPSQEHLEKLHSNALKLVEETMTRDIAEPTSETQEVTS